MNAFTASQPEILEQWRGERRYPLERQYGPAQLEELRREPVLACPLVLLDVADFLHRIQQPVYRCFGKPDRLRSVVQRNRRFWIFAERFQNAEHLLGERDEVFIASAF